MTLAANFLLAVVTRLGPGRAGDERGRERRVRGWRGDRPLGRFLYRPRALSSRLDKCLQRFTPLVSRHSKTSCLIPPRRAILAISAIWWGIELLMMHGERWICRLFRKHFERKERTHRASEQPSSPPRSRRAFGGVRWSRMELIRRASSPSLHPSLPRCFTMPLMSVSFYSTYCISMKL